MNTALDFGNRSAISNIIAVYRLVAHYSEHRMLNELCEFVCHSPDCFLRTEESGAKHIAASVFLMDDALERGLFLKHLKIGQWTQPGGHADGEANIYKVACRELYEETGIDILPEDLLDPVPFDIRRYDFSAETYGYEKTIFNFFFMARCPANQTPMNREPEFCGGIRWVSPEEAFALVKNEPKEVELIEKWRRAVQRIRFRL